jgi:hypothetical protein
MAGLVKAHTDIEGNVTNPTLSSSDFDDKMWREFIMAVKAWAWGEFTLAFPEREDPAAEVAEQNRLASQSVITT